MTVTGTTTPTKTYNGNDSTVNFSVTFQFVDADDLVVVHTDGVGAATTWTKDGSGDTGYTVAGSTVTANTAPATGETLLIYRETDITQGVDFQTNRQYNPELIEGGLDRLTLISQEIEDIDGALTESYKDAAETARDAAAASATAAALSAAAAGQYYYVADPAEADQGVTATGSGDTIYDILQTVGTSKYVTIVLPHTGAANTTTYTLDTSIDMTAYPNVFIHAEPGAMFDRTTGDEILTVYSPANLDGDPRHKITSVDMLRFAYKTYAANPSLLDSPALGYSSEHSYKKNWIVNGAFDYWYSKPTSGVIASPSPAAGFAANTIPDGWYAGPGLSAGTMTIETPQFTAGQTDVSGNPRQWLQMVWTGSVDTGWNEYSIDRNTHLEQNSNESPEAGFGHTFVVSFDAKIGSGTTITQIVPTVWLSMGQVSWLPGQNKVIGDYVQYVASDSHVRLYQATSAGVTGATPPTHTTGIVSDDTVLWEHIGLSKGRAYDIFEGGPNASIGSVHAATGTPGTGAVANLTTSWQRFNIPITLPPMAYNNSTDYSASGDTPRQMLGPEYHPALGGSRPYMGFGFDFIGLPVSTDEINIANVQCERGFSGTPYERQPHRIGVQESSDPSYWLTQYPIVKRTLQRSVSTVDVVNTTDSTQVFSYTIPGTVPASGMLTVNRKLKLAITGDILQNATGSLTVQVLYGSYVLYTAALSPANNATRRGLRIEVDLSASGATNSQVAYTKLFLGHAAVNGSGGTPTVSNSINNSISQNSLVDAAISVTFQWDTASSSCSARMITGHIGIE